MNKTLVSFLNNVSPREIFISDLHSLRKSSQQRNFADVYEKILKIEKDLLTQFGSIPSYARPLIDFKKEIEKKVISTQDYSILSMSINNFKIFVKFIKSIALLDEYKLLLGIGSSTILITILDSNDQYFFQAEIHKSFFTTYRPANNSICYLISIDEFKRILERIPLQEKHFYLLELNGSDKGLTVEYELSYSKSDTLKIRVEVDCEIINKDSEEVKKILIHKNSFNVTSGRYIQNISIPDTSVLHSFLSFCNSFKNDYIDSLSLDVKTYELNIDRPYKELILSDINITDVSTVQAFQVNTLNNININAEYYKSYFKFIANLGLIFLTKKGKTFKDLLETYLIYFDEQNNFRLEFATKDHFIVSFMIAPNVPDKEEDEEEEGIIQTSPEETIEILNTDIEEDRSLT